MTTLLLVSKFRTCRQIKARVEDSPNKSPRRTEDSVEAQNVDIEAHAKKIYKMYTKAATEKLIKFVAKLEPECPPLCVTYFDEADGLELSFWVLLRLLSNQDKLTAMWYVFMATKSSINHFSSSSKKSEPCVFPARKWLIEA